MEKLFHKVLFLKCVGQNYQDSGYFINVSLCHGLQKMKSKILNLKYHHVQLEIQNIHCENLCLEINSWWSQSQWWRRREPEKIERVTYVESMRETFKMVQYCSLWAHLNPAFMKWREMYLLYINGSRPGTHMANKLPEANDPKAAFVLCNLWANASPILTLALKVSRLSASFSFYLQLCVFLPFLKEWR